MKFIMSSKNLEHVSREAEEAGSSVAIGRKKYRSGTGDDRTRWRIDRGSGVLGADLEKRPRRWAFEKEEWSSGEIYWFWLLHKFSKVGFVSDFEIHQCCTSSFKRMVDGLPEKPVLGKMESQMLVSNVECGFYFDHNLVFRIFNRVTGILPRATDS